MEWINKRDRCPGKTFCDHHKTCSSCMSDPYCGWCDDGKNNGLGKCHVGSLVGVKNDNSTQNVLSYEIGMVDHFLEFFLSCDSMFVS